MDINRTLVNDQTALFYYKSFLIEIDRGSKIGTVFRRIRNGADTPKIVGQVSDLTEEVDIVLACFDLIGDAINERHNSKS